MKLTTLVFLLLLSLNNFASECMSPKSNWFKTKTTIEIEEEKSKEKYLYVRTLLINSGEPKNSKILKDIKTLHIINRKDWQFLKREYKKGDKLFELKAPPLSGPIIICLMRNNHLITEIIVADQ